MSKIWANYQTNQTYDELMRSSFQPRPSSYGLCQYLNSLTQESIENRKIAAELAIQEMGISFTVYHQCSPVNSTCGTNLATRDLMKACKDVPVKIAF